MDGDKLLPETTIGHRYQNVYDAETGGRIANEFASYPSIDMVLTKEVAYIVTQKGIYAIDRSAQLRLQKVPGLKSKRRRLNIDAIRKRLRETAGNADEATKITAELAKATTDHAAVVSQIAELRPGSKNGAGRMQMWGPLSAQNTILLEAKVL